MALKRTTTSNFCKNVSISPSAIHMFPLDRFQLVEGNIPGPGACLDDFELYYPGCDCTGLCKDDTCQCHILHGKSYDRKLLNTSDIINSPIFECNSLCNCNSLCSRRLTQFGQTIPLQIFDTENKGLGLKALEDIAKDTFICEYAGEIISSEEANNRLKNLRNDESNYILSVREHFGSRINHTLIDPKFKGNVGRFINHSCDPNLSVEPIRINIAIPKLCFFSQKDIKIGEELSYDYGSLNIMKQSNKQNMLSSKKCFCKTRSCQNFLPMDTSAFP